MKTTSPTMKNMISTLMMMTDQLLLSGHLSQVTWLIFSQRCEQSLNNIQSTVPTHFHTITVLRTSSSSNLRVLFGFKGSLDSRCVDVHCVHVTERVAGERTGTMTKYFWKVQCLS